MSYTNDNLPIDKILCGDNLELIRQLPDCCIQLVITSPPYFQQRDYGGGMGNESSVNEYIDTLLRLFHECVRVVRDDGSIVFNIGDKYQDSSLLLVPYRFALAATDTGLVKLVNEITWVKRNPTPRQFSRRLVSSTEPFFHFVKSDNYFYDPKAFMAESHASQPLKKKTKTNIGQRYFELIDESELSETEKSAARLELAEVIQEVKRGKTQSFRMKIRGIHAAPFGGQEGGRTLQLKNKGFTIIRIHGNKLKRDVIKTDDVIEIPDVIETPVATLKGNKHPAIYPVEVVEEFLHLLTPINALVLDPFMGSGSTAVACKNLGRHYIGYDINTEYCKDARQRVDNTPIAMQRLFEGTQ
ncbi:MAG: site-specific DNA-methyltransferase [Candidatus Poribacteria bacterium]|nr:site-specific DNA-methyltransferase [Candidatus Poribacteria bacterium]